MTARRSGRNGLACELGPEFLEMLTEISVLEGTLVADIMEKIDRVRGRNSRASAVRVFVLKYFQLQAAGEPSQTMSAFGADHRAILGGLFDP